MLFQWKSLEQFDLQTQGPLAPWVPEWFSGGSGSGHTRIQLYQKAVVREKAKIWGPHTLTGENFSRSFPNLSSFKGQSVIPVPAPAVSGGVGEPGGAAPALGSVCALGVPASESLAPSCWPVSQSDPSVFLWPPQGF